MRKWLLSLALLMFSTLATGTNFYISPTGNDNNLGTSQGAPWLRFAHAIPLLNPGDTLNLLDGTYLPGVSGLPVINCTGSPAAKNGTVSAPITVQALNERQAFIAGDGSADSLVISTCTFWNVVGLHIESADNSSNTSGSGTVLSVINSNHITLRRNLLARNNRFGNTDGILLQGTTSSLLSENEVYFFHRWGILLYGGSNNNEVLRNYVNNRGYGNITGGYDNGRFVFGIGPYNGSNSNIFENNIAEDIVGTGSTGTFNGAGFNVEDSASNNNFLGNMSGTQLFAGVRIDPHAGLSQSTGNTFTNQVSVQPTGIGFWARSTKVTTDHMSVFGLSSTQAGAQSDTDPIYPSYSLGVTNTTVQSVSTGTGYNNANTNGTATNTADHDNNFGNAVTYSAGWTTTNPNVANPAFGTCFLWVPLASPLHNAGSTGDIGANVLTQYVGGVLITTPLWNATTGAANFAGATVTGLNDNPSNSLIGIQSRLNINQNGCAFPAGTTGPQVSFNPTSVAFPSVNIGSSTTLTDTVTNNGNATLNISSKTISGTNAGDFTETDGCGASLAAGASCTVTFTFTPHGSGARTANFVLASDAATSPNTLPLSGTGAGTSSLALNPASLSFGTVAPASCSAVLSTTVTSTGTVPLVLSPATFAGTNAADFSFGGTGTCAAGANLAPGSSCTLSVKFCPSTSGAKTASMVVTSNAPTSPDSVPLTGTGGSSTLTLAPTSAACGNVQVGSSSTCQAFTLTNSGTLAVNNIAVSITGTNTSSFSQSNNCPASLASSGTCNITVFFNPAAAGNLTAALTVTGN